MDSPIADMKNSGPRDGGSITAATFLQRFVEEGVKWAHLDITGMVWANKAGQLYDQCATGSGVALIARFVKDKLEGSHNESLTPSPPKPGPNTTTFPNNQV